jgi:hypothetical protein
MARASDFPRTISRGPLAGQRFATQHAWREALARQQGFRSAGERRRARGGTGQFSVRRRIQHGRTIGGYPGIMGPDEDTPLDPKLARGQLLRIFGGIKTAAIAVHIDADWVQDSGGDSIEQQREWKTWLVTRALAIRTLRESKDILAWLQSVRPWAAARVYAISVEPLV